MVSRSVLLMPTLAFAVCVIATVSAHDWLADPLQRADKANKGGELSTKMCGDDDEGVADPPEATVKAGDPMRIEWDLNHEGSANQNVKLYVGGPSYAADNWVKVLDDDIYDDESTTITVPADTELGLRSIQFRWSLGSTDYQSCSNIMVQQAAPGREVTASKCPGGCSKQGKCITTEDLGEYVCSCDKGYSGTSCETSDGGVAAAVILSILAVGGVVGAVFYVRQRNGRASMYGTSQPGKYAAYSDQEYTSAKGGFGQYGSSGAGASAGAYGSTASSSGSLIAGYGSRQPQRMTGASGMTRSATSGSGRRAGGSSSQRSKGSRGGQRSKGSRGGQRSQGSRGGKRSQGSRGSKGSRHGRNTSGRKGPGQRAQRPVV